MNTFADKTNDFFAVLVAEIDRNAAEALIEQISDGLFRDDVFPNLLNGYTDEVGGGLHMIRVNGVVVGAFIGLALGMIRAAVEQLL